MQLEKITYQSYCYYKYIIIYKKKQEEIISGLCREKKIPPDRRRYTVFSLIIRISIPRAIIKLFRNLRAAIRKGRLLERRGFNWKGVYHKLLQESGVYQREYGIFRFYF